MKISNFLSVFLVTILTACSLPNADSLHEAQVKAKKAEMLLSKATHLMIEGELKEATGSIDLARELVGDRADLLDAQGCIEIRRGSFDFAETYFRRAIEADPTFSDAYTHLAFVLERRGQVTLAERLLKRALELKPTSIQARNNYAVILDSRGSSLEARHELYKLRGASEFSLPASEHNLQQYEEAFSTSSSGK